MWDGVETLPSRCQVSAEVSVVVCTLDRPAPLVKCLRAVRQQTAAPAEIVVVSGSAPSLPPRFSTDFPDVRVVSAPGRNLSVSRNAGLREARCPIVAFCDDDAEPQPLWLHELVRPFASPEVAAAGGAVYDAREVPPRLDFSCGRIRLSCKQARILPAEAAETQRPPAGWFRNVCGCNFALRREAILRIGGFDEFFEFAYEEADVAVRLCRAGWRVAHVPAAVVLHDAVPGGYREDDRLKRDWYVEIKNQVYFGLKNARGPLARAAPLARAMGRLVTLSLRWAGAARRGELAASASRANRSAAARGFLAGLQAGLLASRQLPFVTDGAARQKRNGHGGG